MRIRQRPSKIKIISQILGLLTLLIGVFWAVSFFKSGEGEGALGSLFGVNTGPRETRGSGSTSENELSTRKLSLIQQTIKWCPEDVREIEILFKPQRKKIRGPSPLKDFCEVSSESVDLDLIKAGVFEKALEARGARSGGREILEMIPGTSVFRWQELPFKSEELRARLSKH